jgi:hypothetical protein
MSIGNLDAPRSTAAERKQKLIIVGVPVLLGIVLVGCITYFIHRNYKARPPEPPKQEAVAELVSAGGMVLVQDPGRSEWREVKTGTPLIEGTLVRTDSSGEAGIRYRNGSTISIPAETVFTVRNSGENRIEISAPPQAAGASPVLLADESGSAVSPEQEASRRNLELQQIIPFGRSLELIGRVEAGSSLRVNNENVEVTGDGSFKHFTKPFPDSAHTVHLSLKVKDLAGRVRIWTATHTFHTDGDN